MEYGSVFKALYIDKQEVYGRGEEVDEQENSKIDICTCLSVLLATSQAAKTAAVEHNLLKKVIEICHENIQALQLGELSKFTQPGKSTLGQKSVMNKSTLN